MAHPPIIDTHQHLWDLSKFTLPWHAVEDVPSLRRSYVMADYLAATAKCGVVKTVYMEVDVAPEQQPAEASYVLDLCARDDNQMCGAVISGRPGEAGFETYIGHFTSNRYLKGVRRVLHGPSTPPGTCLQPRFVDSIRWLGEQNLRFDLCMRPGELGDAVKLVDQCPKTQFILDHCGNMSVSANDPALRTQWLTSLKALAERPNVMVKISGIIVTANPGWQPSDLAPNINDTLDTFGADRVMFAGDWPVCTLKATFEQWVDALRWIVRDRSPEFQRKLFHDNAARFYNL